MIARVFPSKTKATPTDEFCFFKEQPDLFFPFDKVAEIHISCTFTWDMPKAERMFENYSILGLPIKIGGRAYQDKGGKFVIGRYLKQGYVFTSRGCNNNCWFCDVPKYEGKTRELPIQNGFNILDSNLLQCSENHIRAVFKMLKQQEEYPIFSGGLEAKELKEWHVKLLKEAKTKAMYFANDTPDDLEPLIEVGKLLNRYGYDLKNQTARCYVLVGYRGDTFSKAEKRLIDTLKAGIVPRAMLFRNSMGKYEQDDIKQWKEFQRIWYSPQIISSRLKEGNKDFICLKGECQMDNNFFFDRAQQEYESRMPKENPELEYINEIIEHKKCKKTKEETK